MNFRTQIPFDKEANNLIGYKSKVLLLGSCFSENIGEKFNYFKFQNLINPFGILFNPSAIATFLKRATNQEYYQESDLVFHNEQYHCFNAHSVLSNSKKKELSATLNTILDQTVSFLNDASHVIITLGTSWVYEHIERGQIVANCHKIPQKQFKKKILSIEEIVENLQLIETSIKKCNPKTKIIYTVSPVRHTKDGFVENQLSKSHLITAIHQMLNTNNVSYFPSYEIMMDELRDYRFYKEDMIHPNQIAIDFIWDKFKSVWLHDSANETMKKVEIIQKGMLHKPFNLESDAHQKFIQELEKKKNSLIKELPFIKF